MADLSQRELAAAAGLSPSAVGHAEAGSRDLRVGALARAAAVAGLRLALLDATGTEIAAMQDDTVRDHAARHFPAHLDTVYTEERWSHFEHRLDRPLPWYTFIRDRDGRDAVRQRNGTPHDHQFPQPGDSPAERRAARQRAARRRAQEEWQRRFEAGEITFTEPWTCTCPPRCAELETWEGPPVHASNCGCRCDID